MNRSPALFLAACVLACGALPSPTHAQSVTIYRCTDAGGRLTIQNEPCPSGSTQREQHVQDVPASPDTTTATSRPGPATTSAPPTMPAITGGPQSVERSTDGGFVATGTDGSPRMLGRIDLPTMSSAGEPQRSSDGGFITTSVGPEPQILDSANLSRTPAAQDAESDADRPPLPPLFRCTTYDRDTYLTEDKEVPPRCLPLRTVGLDGNPATGAGAACEVVRDRCSRIPDGEACEAWRRHAREAKSRWQFAHPDNIERRRTEYERLEKIVADSCG